LIVLGTLGNNAPFIGLFGTVLGIIKAFSDLAENTQGGADVVMAGISEALVATAVGLIVAIPAVIAFNYFNRRVRAVTTATDDLAHTILSELYGQAHGAPAAEGSAALRRGAGTGKGAPGKEA
jgi:biopolymer transport protein ExbB